MSPHRHTPWIIAASLLALAACGQVSAPGGDAGNSSSDASSDPDDAAPTVDATPVPSTVFVTAQPLPSNLNGLIGADALCEEFAAAVGLAGTYQAILSDATASARDRLVVFGPVVDTRGTVIAGTVDELWSGIIRAPIAVDEAGQPVGGNVIVWTGTDADGTADRGGSDYCGNWNGQGQGGVEAGRTDRADAGWISIYGAGNSGHACSNQSRLYCIETHAGN